MRYGLLLAVLIGTSLTSRAGDAKPASPGKANLLKGLWYTHDEVRQCTFLFLVTESKIALEVLKFEAPVPPRLASGYRLVEEGKHRYILFLDAKSAKIEGIPPRIGYRIMGDRMELSFPEGRLQGTWTLKRHSPAPSDLPFERIKKGKKENSAGGNLDPFEIQLSLVKGHSLTLTRISPEHALLATTTVITNSQYVLAVKEKAVPAPVLPVGLDRAKWQKVLWNLDKFPPGQESHAVLFVNCSEAEAFCRWLDRRFPAYRFRLPNPTEGIALETNRSELNSPRLENGYASRPARGGGDQLLSKRRFWHAPLTMELLDYREFVKAGTKTFALPTREQRHEWIVGGSYHLPEAFPSSFRVIAVPVAKESGGRKGKRVSPVPTSLPNARGKANAALTLKIIHPPDKHRPALQTFDFEGIGAGLIHRPGPEHFKLARLDNAKVVGLMVAYRPNELGAKPSPSEGKNATKLAYNSLFKGVRLRLDSGPGDVKGPVAAEQQFVRLFARAPLELGVRYRLTWACWPVGAPQATEVSCDFALGQPAAIANQPRNGGKPTKAEPAVARWEEIIRLDGHKNPVRWMSFSPDAALLAAGASDGRVGVWDVAKAKKIRSLGYEPIRFVAFTPDGKQLVTAGPGRGHALQVRLWDPTTGNMQAQLGGGGGGGLVDSVALSPDGKLMVIGRTEGSVQTLALGENSLKRIWFANLGFRVTAVAVSPDARRIAVVGGGSSRLLDRFPPVDHPIPDRSLGELRLLDAATGKPLFSVRNPIGLGAFRKEAGGAIATVAYSPDGKLLASSNGADGTLFLQDAQTGKIVRQLPGHADSVLSLAFSPNGKLLASCGVDAKVRIWDPATGQELAVLPLTAPTTVLFSPDNQFLAASGGGGVRLWRERQPKEKKPKVDAAK